jgi:hypothetical protein
MLEEQKRAWPMLRQNFAGLSSVQARRFDFGGFEVQVQFNPTRLASTVAKVDEKSIRQRKCFLCDANRPIEQTSMDCGGGFKMLCNPYPILPEHFTIILQQHLPQRIGPHFARMLELTRALGSRYTTFYNGPQCGASAPDHMHFQAGTRDVMPIDIDYPRIKRPAGEREGLEVFVSENYLRYFIGLESEDPIVLEAGFNRLYDAFHRLVQNGAEPMMNLLGGYDNGRWRVVVFPRVKHRPNFFFAVDHTKMLLSPGTIDIGGMVVAVVEQDFNRIGKEHLAQMFGEITISAELVKKLADATAGSDQPAGVPAFLKPRGRARQPVDAPRTR